MFWVILANPERDSVRDDVILRAYSKHCCNLKSQRCHSPAMLCSNDCYAEVSASCNILKRIYSFLHKCLEFICRTDKLSHRFVISLRKYLNVKYIFQTVIIQTVSTYSKKEPVTINLFYFRGSCIRTKQKRSCF